MSHADAQEFSGTKGHFFAWFLTSPLRRVLEWKMGKPEERILELLDLSGGEHVLDAGCGSGFHTLLIAERLTTGDVLAVDISTEMLERLRKNARAKGLADRMRVLMADNLALPVPSESMDRALAAAVWHHLDDPQGACDEMVRTLRPGGRLVVSDLAIGDKKAVAGLSGHDRTFLAEDMHAILTQSNLIDVVVTPVGRWLVGAGDKPEVN